VSTAASPAAIAAAFAAFFAVPLTFDRVMELERLIVFDELVDFVFPRFALAPDRLDADFAVLRLDAFFIRLSRTGSFNAADTRQHGIPNERPQLV
jgi:hypothetical protein